MRVLPVCVEPSRPGAENMRRDSEMLDAVDRGEPGSIRIYGFAPDCLSVGRLQALDDGDIQAHARQGVDTVRRPTGGRAVLHRADEVTYAVACLVDDQHFGGTVLESCARIHAPIMAGLERLGVVTGRQRPSRDERVTGRARARVADCFASAATNEIVGVAGVKLVGSAQARRGPALLQHGSIPLRLISAAAGREVSRPELVDAVRTGFEEVIGERHRPLSTLSTPLAGSATRECPSRKSATTSS